MQPENHSKAPEGTPKVAEARDDERGKFVDICEMTLKGFVYEKDLRAVFFALNKLGKDRGYGDQLALSDEGTRLELIEEIVTVPAPNDENRQIRLRLPHPTKDDGAVLSSIISSRFRCVMRRT
jgi:hypothetical protein